VRASEEEALRRVAEKKKTARRDEPARDTRAAQRNAQRRVTELETQIQSLESRIDKLTHELEDPELYTKTNGVTRATVLGVDLEKLKKELERTLEEWGTASDALDTYGASGP
jgi:TolA-binding protein